MTIKGMQFQKQDIKKATWNSPDGITRNQIDHYLTDARHATDVHW